MGIHEDNDGLRIDLGLERGVTRLGFRVSGQRVHFRVLVFEFRFQVCGSRL